jgi:zinc protease
MRLIAALATAAAVVLTWLMPLRAGEIAATGAEVAHFTLANGLELVVVPDRRTPVVTHMIWYKVGSADEPPGKTGIAHFLEHLMFKGTAKNPAGRFSATLATIGGMENAFTSTDYTAYFQRVSREYLSTLMEFEADRMTGLVLTEDNVLSERNVVLEEYNQRVGNDPASQLGEQVQAALFLNHPYRHPVIGWRNEIDRLNREDAFDFYRRFYTPNNAVVVVAGDVAPPEVLAVAEATYGKVERRSDPQRLRPAEPETLAVRHITFADPRVTQPSLQRSYLVPSLTTAQPGEAEALDVLAQILGSGSNSRLYRALVVERPLAASAGSWYQETALDLTRFGVSATPRPGVTLHDLEDAIDGVIADVAKHGVTAEELERAKSRMVADYIYAQDSQSTLARIYGGALTTGSSVEQVRSRPQRIRAVTADAVLAAARKWLDKRRSVTGHLVKAEAPRREDKRS